MGKSHKSVNFSSISESWKADKSRSFAKRNKKEYRHKIRNDNRNIDDETKFVTTANMKKLNEISGYNGKLSNVSIYPDNLIHDTFEYETEYLNICEKQLQRRGECKRFYGYKKELKG